MSHKTLPVLMVIVLTLNLIACSSKSKYAFDDLPEQGDPQRGAILFSQGVETAPACSTCHRTDAQNAVGPGLAGLADRAGQRVEGQSAREYVFNSIVRPAQYTVRGFSNLMYSEYDKKLTLQDIADLIAYVLKL